MKTSQERIEIWQSEQYQNRVRELEKDGCTTSDAQGIADVEFKVYYNCHFIEQSENTRKRNRTMKKTLIVLIIFILNVSNCFAYNQDSFYDQAEISIHGNRPKVDIEVSELSVTILEDDFVDGIAKKNVKVANEGNVPCRIEIEVSNVPVDLNVTAEVDDVFLLKGQSTELNITVELTEQQTETSFNFSILIKANLRP